MVKNGNRLASSVAAASGGNFVPVRESAYYAAAVDGVNDLFGISDKEELNNSEPTTYTGYNIAAFEGMTEAWQNFFGHKK